MSTEPLKEAIQNEVTRFEKFYLWLEKSMPSIFFKEVSKEWISLIVHSLMNFQEQDFFTDIHLKDGAISLCLDSPEADVKILRSYPLFGIKHYTTYISREPLPFENVQGNLRVATLKFTEVDGQADEPLSAEMQQELTSFLNARHPEWPTDKIDLLIKQMDDRFIRKMPLNRKVLALEMFERAKTRDDCQYEVEFDEEWEKTNSPSIHIILAWKNVPKHHFLYQLARVIYRHGLVMRRATAAYINPYSVDSIFMLSFGLHGATEQAAWEAADIVDFLQEMVTVKFFEPQGCIDTVFVETGLLRGNLGNFLMASVDFIHQVLVQIDPHLYSTENIEEALCRHPEITVQMCTAFEQKFNPLKHNYDQFEKTRDAFVKLVNQLDTGHEYHDIRRKNILLQGMNFINHILKTNFYKNNKTALAFRLDPNYLEYAPFDRKKIFPELPYGIFYIYGMNYIAFHIRFKDLSRGGLRTVYPKRKERVLAERNTIFSECYNLAYTQNKKNKDIPEGGSKGIIFLKPYEQLVKETEVLTREMHTANLEKEEIDKKISVFTYEQELEFLYQSQRTFIKSFLTLINCNPDGSLRSKHIVDYWNKPEYIYLGPDENMYDPMIEWIARESKNIHYKPGGAFISGKPQLGINHKEYGVTSLGVNVFMEEVLNYLNIDPTKDKFTVKMTGGPDGDVAGNQILNLQRYYPQTAKLIALTDVSGTIYDPEGLDLAACANLFHTSKPIRFYPPEKLNPGGFLLDKETRKEPTPYVQHTLCWRKVGEQVISDWLSGNEMNALYRYNVHQTTADIFIPCGGRPRTLRESNYKEFLDKAGNPTSKAIIEGANLYLTQGAREQLEKLGVLVVMDSSANKCGVICSSFEILCGLALSDTEFLSNKPLIVPEILERLKICALNEARLLLNEHQSSRRPLTEISEEISQRINFFTDQLLAYFTTMNLPEDPHDPLIQCFLHYCPKTLFTKFQKELLKEIPENHKKAIIASHIASTLVYKRGLNWFPSLIEILPILLQDPSLIYGR